MSGKQNIKKNIFTPKLKPKYHYDILFNGDARVNFEWVKDLCSTITIKDVQESFNKSNNE